jgi:hypothetical protein
MPSKVGTILLKTPLELQFSFELLIFKLKDEEEVVRQKKNTYGFRLTRCTKKKVCENLKPFE